MNGFFCFFVKDKNKKDENENRSPDDRKETQTEAGWTCFPFIWSGQNHLARQGERGKKTKQTEKEVGRHQGTDRPGFCQVPEGSGEQRKMEETGCEVIRGDPTTLAMVKGQVKVKMETVAHFLLFQASLGPHKGSFQFY